MDPLTTCWTEYSLLGGGRVRIRTQYAAIPEGAYYQRVGKPHVTGYFHDDEEITVEQAGSLLSGARYPIRCQDGVLVRYENQNAA